MARRLLVATGLVVAGAVAAQQVEQDPQPRPRKMAVKRAAPATAPARGSDWPGFLGPRGDARSSETGILTEWPPGGPPLVWHAAIGEGYSMPSVAGGRIFVFDRQGGRARLRALAAETGREQWRVDYPTDYRDYYGFSNGPRTSPVVDGDRVYTYGVEGRLRCHRVSDGALLWEVDTAARFGVVQNFFGVGSTPVIEGDLLIAQVGGSPPDSPKVQSGSVTGNGSGIVAFDKRTGEVRYRVTDELASYSAPVLATIGDRRWALVLARGGLVGLHPATGKVDFRFPWRASKIESVNAASPVVAGDLVFVTESYGPGGALLRVRPGGYDVVRKDESRRGSLRSHWSTPVHDRGTLYGCHGSGSGDAELRAVDLRSGEVRWRQSGMGRTTLLYVDGHLVVLGEYGKLHLVRATPERFVEVATAEPRDEQGRALLRHPAWNAPILAHGLLYVRGKDRLACLRLIPRAANASRPAGR